MILVKWLLSIKSATNLYN